ncbi:MAG: hypothetical protein ABL901_02815 [Hyphomicrobiaceae bacterium]
MKTEIIWRVTYWLAPRSTVASKETYTAAHTDEKRLLDQVKRMAVGNGITRAIAHKVIRTGSREDPIETRHFDDNGKEKRRVTHGVA